MNPNNAAPTMPPAPTAMDTGKGKSNKGLIVATAITSVLAVCGIGFGVFGMIQSAQKDDQISDLKVQIKDSDGTITEIETPQIETTANNGTTVTITDSVTTVENPEDYVYIGEWGKKIKIPENLTAVKYSFANTVNLGTGYNKDCSNLGVSAITTSDGLEAVNNEEDLNYLLGFITRCPAGTEFLPWVAVTFSADGYDYYYEFPNGISTENHPQWMFNSVDLVKDMLTNADNYSSI